MTDDEKQNAIDAKRFSEDPVCQRILLLMANHYRKTIEESEYQETELREDCYRQLRAVRDFNRQLTVIATRGKLELVRRGTLNGGSNSAA